MADDAHNTFSSIPTWDGNPGTWARFYEEVRIWKLSINLDVKYSQAARLIGRLSGSAKRACTSLTDDDLLPQRYVPPGPDQAEVAEDLARGIDRVVAHLRATLGPEKSVRKGQSMQEFFGTTRYRRMSGERITDWITRWDEDGVKFLEQQDIAGWFFLRMANLSPESRELVLAQVPEDKS